MLELPLAIIVVVSTLMGGMLPQQQGDICVAYYGDEQFCIPGNITLKTWFTPAPIYIEGNAVWYAPWVMEATANYRGLNLEGYLDGVSLMSPADIGKTVWIKHPEFGWEGPYLAVDCAQQNHMYGVIVSRNEVVEVGYRTAVRWGMVNYRQTNEYRIEDVEVYIGKELPEYIADPYLSYKYGVVPINYETWFLHTLEFTSKREGRPIIIGPSTWKMPDGTIFENSK